MVTAAIALLLVFGWLSWLAFFREPGFDRVSTSLAAGREGTQPGENPGRPKPVVDADKGKLAGKEDSKRGLIDDPNILTVSQKPEANGKYRTIGEALRHVKAGQTIRVLDNATYPEALVCDRPEAHTGITIEAPFQATLAPREGTAIGVQLSRVPGITLRGFRMNGLAVDDALVQIEPGSTGAILEELELELPRAVKKTIGVRITAVKAEGSPIVLRRCRSRGGYRVLHLSGQFGPCSGVVVLQNTFTLAGQGVWVGGAVSRIQLVANRFENCAMSGIVAEHVDSLLVFNNTFLECKAAILVGGTAVKGRNVQFCNNLVLGASQPDWMFFEVDPESGKVLRPGEVSLLAKNWRITHNWREVAEPQGNDPKNKGWVPPGPKDVRKDTIDGINRDPKSPDFLRPTKDSPLASAGAGKTDPSLPLYVGAVPPEGVPAWDWSRTWQAPPPGRLLTVSKSPEDGGTYRTINDALKAAKPWTTIRVLDGAEYAEPIVLDDPKEQQGIVLEAPKHATIMHSAKVRVALTLKGVSDVRVKGFRFRQSISRGSIAFVSVSSRSSGVVLEALDLQASGPLYGIVLNKVEVPPGAVPLLVKHCHIQVGSYGISVSSPTQVAEGLAPCSGIILQNNRVWGGLQGIHLEGSLARVQVVGNLLWNASQAALQIQDLGPQTEQILIANNTAFDSNDPFRIWNDRPDEQFPQRQIELCNNLFFEASEGDMIFALGSKDGIAMPSLGRAKAIVDSWQFHHNWRDGSGAAVGAALPQASRDKTLNAPQFASRDPSKAGFMRPTADSVWAKQGAGRTDPSLPSYVGAVPPAGIEAWDWERTWRARTARKTSAAK
jgi:hypothetical protein